jgi:hypothetical protein
VGQTTATSFQDTAIALDLDYWYRVRAVDAAGNLGPLTAPIWAMAPDRVGPGNATVNTDEGGVIIVDPAPPCDTAVIHLSCRFGTETQEHYLQQLEVEGCGPTVFSLYEFYSPTVPVSATCKVQPFDAHGNAGGVTSVPVTGAWHGCLGPTTLSLPAPVITSITTVGTTGHYRARVEWDVATDPTLTGFRVVRAEARGTTVVTLATESTLKASARSFEDSSIVLGTVYSYTVAAYRAASTCNQAALALSLGYAYRAEPPLGQPKRTIEPINWVAGFPSYMEGSGTSLAWEPLDVPLVYVVYRSLWQDHGYLAITPAESMAGGYSDQTATHDRYWYIVVRLDPVTGEVVAATEPASPNPNPIAAAATVSAETSSLLAEPLTPPERNAGTRESAAPQALPSALIFGGGHVLEVAEYGEGATLSNLFGVGIITFYPNGEPLPVALEFGGLAAEGDGLVTSGEVDVPLPTQAFSPEGGFYYEIGRLALFPGGAWGMGGQALPYDLVLPEQVLPPDAYEPDDTLRSASDLVANGGHQTHNFHRSDDMDAVALELEAGVPLIVQTYNLFPNADTILTLYDENGAPLASNDDYEPLNLASRLSYVTGAAGTYYVRVTPYGDWRTGWDSDYQVAAGIGFLFDTYEFDDVAEAATPIWTQVQTQTHNLHHPEDIDWISLEASAGTEYRFIARYDGETAATTLWLFDTDGETRLGAWSACGGDPQATCFDWTFPTAGVYYVAVVPQTAENAGPGSEYSFWVTTVGSSSTDISGSVSALKGTSTGALSGAGALGSAGTAATAAEVRFGLPWHYVQFNTQLEMLPWTFTPPSQSCSDPALAWPVIFESLPWQIAPLGTITFGPSQISLGPACTQYDDPYSDTRPAHWQPDANDAYLRAQFDSAAAAIRPGGLAGTFTSTSAVQWTSPVPYYFQLNVQPNIVLELANSVIQGGQMGAGSVSFAYYDGPPTKHTQAQPLASLPAAPQNTLVAEFEMIDIEPGGALYATVVPTGPIHWSAGAFWLDEEAYELVLPPVQSLELPQREAIGGLSTRPHLEVGLNRYTLPGESANFSWNHCASENGFPIRFPGPVEVDVYVRRGGISDLIDANIPPGQPIIMSMHGYSGTLESFRVTWLDNYIYDRDIAGWVLLPYPAQMDVHMPNMLVDSFTGCVDGGATDRDPKVARYWNLNLWPTSLAFRQPPPAPPTGAKRTMWLIGATQIPHLELATASPPERIPVESAFAPDGDTFATKFVQAGLTYDFEGYSLLLEGLRLSAYDRDAVTPGVQRELPVYDERATAAPRPAARAFNGFIGLKGVLTLPYYGTVSGPTLSGRPELILYAGDEWVGFSQRPRVKRLWTKLSTLSLDYTLTFVHSRGGTQTLTAVGWRQHDLGSLYLDSSTVITKGGVGLYLGLSSGSAALQTLAEAGGYPLDASFGPLGGLGRTMTHWWVPKLTAPSGPSMPGEYVNLLARTWVMPAYPVAQTTQRLDAAADLGGALTGGGTQGSLKNDGAYLYDIRGQAGYDAASDDFTTMRMSASFEVSKGDRQPLVEIQRITLELTRDGKRVLSAKNIQVHLYEYDLPRVDAILLIKSWPPGVEGGLTIYDFDIEVISFSQVGAVFGVGTDILYVGAMAANADIVGLGNMGGGFLAGTLQPGGSSGTVLKAAGFGDLLDALGESGASGGYTGAYARVYGDFPVYSYSCLLEVNVGGDVAVWVFASVTKPDIAYGGRVRGYVYGKVLCALSARGDLTMQVAKPAGSSKFTMLGDFWVAGGIGFCDPDSWSSWESRWWGDSWCWTCGADVRMEYQMKNDPNGWWTDSDGDCE